MKNPLSRETVRLGRSLCVVFAVEALDCSGRFSAKTTSGNVRLELKNLPEGEAMQLATINGSVVLSIPANAGAELDVAIRNGNFHSDFPLRARTSHIPQLFRGKIGKGGSEIILRTVNGTVQIVQNSPVI
jgi:DUF4097 and DUF4098 domain-containing protein YvlB